MLTTNRNIKQKEVDSSSELNVKDACKELSFILNLSWPIVLDEFLSSSPMIYNMRIAGLLGTYELAASTLSMTTFLIFALSPLLGTLTGLETLQSQAITASRHPKWVGILAQRAILIILALFIPIFIFCYNFESILLFLGQEKEISKLAGKYMFYFFPCIPLLALIEVIKRFMVIQGITKPSLIISIIVMPIHICLVSFATDTSGLNLGLIGIPLTMMIIGSIRLVLLLFSVKITGADYYFDGFSKEAFKDWFPFMKIALPGMIMVAGAVWPIEFISFLVSYFGPAPLSAQAIIGVSYQVFALILVPLALGSSVRVGNLLGSSLLFKARLNARVVLLLAVVLGLFFNFILFYFRANFIQFFSRDEQVYLIADKILAVVSFGLTFYSIATLSGAILRGQGKQSIGAFFKLSGCYLVSIPLGWYLAIKFELGLLGLWVGVVVSWIYCAIGEAYYVLTTDWREEIRLCHSRI
ncbi:MATE efflux family protein, partial [Neoconidiobolus thromboides FSU 785]